MITSCDSADPSASQTYIAYFIPLNIISITIDFKSTPATWQPTLHHSPSIRPKNPLADPIDTNEANITSRRIHSYVILRGQIPIISRAKPSRRRITRVGRIRLSKVDLKAETWSCGRVGGLIGDALVEAGCRNDGLRDGDVEIICEEDCVREFEGKRY